MSEATTLEGVLKRDQAIVLGLVRPLGIGLSLHHRPGLADASHPALGGDRGPPHLGHGGCDNGRYDDCLGGPHDLDGCHHEPLTTGPAGAVCVHHGVGAGLSTRLGWFH
jgi:hypothetical protein